MKFFMISSRTDLFIHSNILQYYSNPHKQHTEKDFYRIFQTKKAEAAELHTIEHLAATFLRNHKEFGSKMIYWGPMGCRTGNYLLLNGDYESKDIVPLMIETFEFIRDFEGEVPGASAKDCGNYLDMNLPMAKYLAGKFLDEVLYDIKPDRLIYPQ